MHSLRARDIVRVPIFSSTCATVSAHGFSKGSLIAQWSGTYNMTTITRARKRLACICRHVPQYPSFGLCRSDLPLHAKSSKVQRQTKQQRLARLVLTAAQICSRCNKHEPCRNKATLLRLQLGCRESLYLRKWQKKRYISRLRLKPTLMVDQEIWCQL